jgi:hypothetical protein
VIASAVRDLEKPMRAGGKSARGRVCTRILMISNPNLKFWCQVANFDVNAILRTYGNGGKMA